MRPAPFRTGLLVWGRTGRHPLRVPSPSPPPLRPAFAFVTPSLGVSGGTLEIVKLARDLAARGHVVEIVALWHAAEPVDTGGVPVVTLSAAGFARWRAIACMPTMLLAFRRWRRHRARAPRIVFSHYATFVVAPAVRRRDRWFLVQDTEWRFARAGAYRALVLRFVLATLRRGRVVTTGAYLSQAMAAAGVAVAAQVDIWADPGFAAPRDGVRDVDVVLVLRHGAHKRIDLARTLIERGWAAHPEWRIAAITPDAALASPVVDKLAVLLVRPDLAAMRDLHARARLHLMLSDHEGFGLPPLEAMGAGCVPLCRDAGGVRAYVSGALADNLVPLAADVEALIERAAALIGDRPRWEALSKLAGQVFDEGQRAQPHRLDAPAARPFVEA